jgi:formylglycine-generating enzyme required for sulfatase activity
VPGRSVARLAAALSGAAAVCLSFAAPAAALEPGVPSGQPVSNSVGMRLVLVPAGTFTMGSPPGAPLRQDEETTRQVTLTKAFRISATEVTQKQWAVVMGTAADSAAGDLPVASVSWNDAQAFCRKLSQKEGASYRLPTEAEWEYACRAGADASAVDRDAVAWHAGNSDGEAHAVAQKQPNAWLLHDLLGNVAEWTQDAYAPYPLRDQTDPAGPATGGAKAVRGGSFRSFPPALRCAARTGVGGAYQQPHVGLRVVQTLP